MHIHEDTLRAAIWRAVALTLGNTYHAEERTKIITVAKRVEDQIINTDTYLKAVEPLLWLKEQKAQSARADEERDDARH
jgi:RNase P/RNase MRP subunit POP5